MLHFFEIILIRATIFHPMSIVDYLNVYANLLLAIITFILVVITAFYTWFTHKMVNVMAKQMRADIHIQDIRLFSGLHYSYEHGEMAGRDTYYRLYLKFSIFNKNEGSGGIVKPILIFKCPPADIALEIDPVTKKQEVVPNDPREMFGSGKIVTTDLGNAIYLRGGEIQVIELRYEHEFKKEVLENIWKHFDKTKFFIRHNDNFGKSYNIEISNIIPYR